MTEQLRWPNIIKSTLLPSLPGFTHKRRLIYKTPVGELLQAFVIDTCGDTREYVVVHCFIMPLFIPKQHLTLTYGQRLRDPRTNSEAWHLADGHIAFRRMAEAMQTQRTQFLDTVKTPQTFIAYIARTRERSKSVHILEALGYSYTIVGAYGEAARSMREAQVQLDLTAEWERAMHERLDVMLRYLSGGAFDEARAQIETWRKGTMMALGVS